MESDLWSSLWSLLETKKAMWFQWLTAIASAVTLNQILTTVTIVYTLLLIVAHVRKEYGRKK